MGHHGSILFGGYPIGLSNAVVFTVYSHMGVDLESKSYDCEDHSYHVLNPCESYFLSCKSNVLFRKTSAKVSRELDIMNPNYFCESSEKVLRSDQSCERAEGDGPASLANISLVSKNLT